MISLCFTLVVHDFPECFYDRRQFCRKGVTMAQAYNREAMTRTDIPVDLYFGSFHLERDKRLWCGGSPITLRPRPLTVLRYLAERAGRLVTSEELRKQLWPGIYVTKTVLRVCISEIRHALQEDVNAPQLIETV